MEGRENRPSAFLPFTKTAFHILLSLVGCGQHDYGIIRTCCSRPTRPYVSGRLPTYGSIRRLIEEGLRSYSRRHILAQMIEMIAQNRLQPRFAEQLYLSGSSSRRRDILRLGGFVQGRVKIDDSGVGKADRWMERGGLTFDRHFHR